MRYRQQRTPVIDESITDLHSVGENQGLADTGSFGHNDPTIDCYKRRARILANAHRAEWWMAAAVLILIASIGFIAL